MVGTYDTQTPTEQWNKDLEDMPPTGMQTERELCPENPENLHWMELALEDPMFQVRSARVKRTNQYLFDITQKPPTKEGPRNLDFEIVYPIYHELNQIIEQTKPAKATRIKIRASSREHWEVVYTCEFRVDQWSYNKVDEITERLADQLTMTQNLNGGLLIHVSFKE